MIGRREFLAAIAAIPVVGLLVPKTQAIEKKPTLWLPETHRKVCCVGQGKKQCRYLGFDDDGKNCHCLKLYPVYRKKIDEQVTLFEQNSPFAHFVHDTHNLPLGDNCKGIHPTVVF